MRPEPIPAGPNQESVWDYPRPPRVEDVAKHIKIVFNSELLVDTHHAKRVLETSHPPNYYIPEADIRPGVLIPSAHSTFCEWKGWANYYSVKVGEAEATNAAWYYPNPNAAFVELKGYVGFYPEPMDACYVDKEKVRPQAGTFYAGWITNNIVGPFKGESGTRVW